MQLIARENELFLLQAHQNSVNVWRYNGIELDSLILVKFNTNKNFTVKSIIIDNKYDGNGPIGFIITIEIEKSQIEVYLCEIHAK